MVPSLTPIEEEQFKKFLNEVADKARNEINIDGKSMERLFKHKRELATHLAEDIQRFSIEVPSYDLARKILSRDFISPEEIMSSRKLVVYTKEQLANLVETVPPQEVLEWCHDHDYMLLAGPSKSLSLLEIRELRFGYFYFKQDGWWYTNQKFAEKDKVDIGWIMIRKSPIPQSVNRSWKEQRELLSDVEFVPNISVVAWAVTTYKATRGEYLLSNIFVRTSSMDSTNNHVFLGEGGPIIIYWRDDERYTDLGVVAVRK